MTKSKQRQRLNGTVLIMILTVMFVLIIMLMATLTVVTTASQRIYTKFEENQSYYTSRSALEVFTSKMLSDNQYKSADGSGEHQGYQLQKALYSIKSKDGHDKNTTLGNPTKEYIEYKVTLPTVGNAADSYGKFSDEVTIKVEVLERTYDPDDNRADDSMVIKITATSMFNGVEGSSSVKLEVGPSTGANNATRAVTSLSGLEMDMNNLILLGGLATPGNAKLGNQGYFWGNIYYGGETNNGGGGSKYTLVGDESFYIKNGVSGVTNAFPLRGISNAKGDPVVFVDGDFNITQSNTGDVYDAAQPIAMVVTRDLSTTGEYKSSGDVYVMGDFSTTSKIVINGDLYLATDNACSADGSAVISLTGGTDALTVTGDLHLMDASKIWDLAGKITIGGRICMPSVATLPDGIDAAKVDFNAQKFATVVRDPAAGTITVTLNNSTTSNIINVNGRVFNQYRRNGDPAENWISASEYAFTPQEELEKIIVPGDPDTYPEYSDKRIHEYYNEHINSATKITTSGGTFTAPGKYYMEPGQYMNNIVFDAGGEVELFLKPCIGWQNYSQGGAGCKIIVHPGTKLKVYCVPGQYKFDNFCFTTPEVESGDPIYVGDYAPTGESLIDVRTTFFVEGTSELYFSNNDSYIIGHVYAPYGKVFGGTSGKTLNIYYNGEHYTESHGFVIVGSVLANHYSSGGSSKGGVAFVKGLDNSTPPPVGETFLTFQEVQYSRN